MPFVTEELWHALTGEPESVLLGKDDYITADEGKIDEEEESKFAIVQDAIEAVRLVRSTLKLSPSKQAEIVVQARESSEGIMGILESSRTILESLGNASTLIIANSLREYPSKEYASEIRQRVRVFVKIQERSEEEKSKERMRLTKELVRVQSLYEQGRGKLENENFRNRAPVEILQKEHDKLVNYKSQLEQLQSSIADLS
ncbi:MAG TPA: class I tRNA ligase family protein, partial [Candidatus Kapabacteria bacterium]|nr:class I tRNA ligase family protein [Candidatus Kapabacteria bacterium]